MERYDVDANRAFALLTRLPQRNVKMRQIAIELTSTRSLPAPQAENQSEVRKS